MNRLGSVQSRRWVRAIGELPYRSSVFKCTSAQISGKNRRKAAQIASQNGRRRRRAFNAVLRGASFRHGEARRHRRTRKQRTYTYLVYGAKLSAQCFAEIL